MPRFSSRGFAGQAVAWVVRTCLAMLLMGGLPQAANAQHSEVSVCNASTSMSLYVAHAFQFNWGHQYEASGWHEIGPALGMGSLGHRCIRLAGGLATPTYFALAHLDEAGKFSLYQYEFELGGSVRVGGRWMCVSPTRGFRYEARDFDALGRCEAGAVQIPFPHLIKTSDGDREMITINPQASPAGKLATFLDIAKGRYGAFAVSAVTGHFASSYDKINATTASQAALEGCGQPTCKVVLVAQARCLAIAHADVARFKVGAGSSQAGAESAALAECSKAFGSCKRPAPGGCSGGPG